MGWSHRGRFGRSIHLLVAVLAVASVPSGPIPAIADGPGALSPEVSDASRARLARVLIIGSYERFVTSMSMQEDALRERLSAEFPNIQIRADALTSGAGPTPELTGEARRRLADTVLEKWRDLNPDVIVTIDTLAFDLMTGPEGRSVFPRVPLIFSGVMWSPEEVRNRIAGDASGAGVTGVLERIDIRGSLALMRRMQPDLAHVLVVGGVHERGANLRNEVRRQLASVDAGVKLTWATSSEIGDVINTEAAALGPGGAVLYLSHYPSEHAGSESLGTWEHWPVPMYVVFESNLQAGTVGGRVVSFRSQGLRAGEMAAQVLKGGSARDIPIDESAAVQNVFRFDNLRRWELLARVPQGAQILGAPGPWIERWGTWLALGTAVAAVQMLVIPVLLILRARAKRAEQAVSTERDRFFAMLEGSTDGFWDWDVHADRTTWSRHACELLGLNAQARVVSRLLWDQLLHQDDRERAHRALRNHLERGTPYVSEYRLKLQSGEFRWFRSRGVAIRDEAGRAVRMVGTLIDIDALVRADERLREAEARYRLITEHSQDFIVHFGRDGRRLYRSPASERVFPLSDQEQATHDHHARVHPDDHRHLAENRESVLSGRSGRFEMRAIDRDDRVRWLDMQISPIIDADGTVNSYVCYGRDITERKVTEQKLREAEELYAAIFARHPYPMWVFDNETLRFCEVNQAAVETYGWSREEFLGMTILDIRPESERSKVAAFVQSRDPAAPSVGQWVHMTRDGRVIDVLVSTHAIPSAGGRRIRVATVIDITEKRAVDRWQQRQSEILERVAAGAPVATVFEAICQLVQEQAPGVLASVLLLKTDGKTIESAAAPDLPPEYTLRLDGVEIGPNVGSCGTAMYVGKRVVVSDIGQSPLWVSYRDFVLSFGLRSCWSDPIRLSDGQVVGSLAMYSRTVREPTPRELDIIASAAHLAGIALERDRAIAALRKSEAKFRGIVETAQEGIWVVDINWCTTLANATMGRMLGVRPEGMIGKPITEYMDDEGRRIIQDYQQRRIVGQSEVHDFKFIRADGRPLWAIVATNPIASDSGEYDGSLAMVTDITERRAAEDALRAERRLFLSGPAIAWRWRVSEGWPVEYVSENVAMLGYSAADFVSGRIRFIEIMHPDDVARVAAEIQDHLANNRAAFEQQYRVRTRDGRWRIVADHTVVDRDPSGQLAYFVGYTIDVTERSEIEARLRESQQTTLSLIAAIPDTIFRMHRDGRYLAVHTNNPHRLLVPPEQFLGRPVRDVLPRALGEQCEHHLAELFRTGQEQTYEYEVRRDGRDRTCWEVRMSRSGEDEALLLVRDVTVSRDNERKLRQSEARLSMFVNSAPVGVISWSTEFTVTAWNPAAERIFGYSSEQAIGRHGSFIVPATAKPYVDDVWRNLLTRSGGVRGTNENLRADGSVIVCEWYNTPLVDARGRVIGVASIVEDVTERRLAQRRQDLILKELDHRVKNNLAAVIALAEQTGRSVATFPEFMERFVGRLNAMARTHGALARSRWQGVQLRAVVSQTLEVFSPGETGRLIMEGPDITVPPRAAQALTMALNELATNAAKYGALSGSKGRVAVRWSLRQSATQEPAIDLDWTESDGPPVGASPSPGYGSELIQGAIAHELRGTVHLGFEPSGVTCAISFPLRQETAEEPHPTGDILGLHL